MVWKLTPQQLAYGKQHELILSNYPGLPMANSKIPLLDLGIKFAGSNYSTNFAQTRNGLYGPICSWKNSEYTPIYQFYTYKRFVVTRFRWNWNQSGTGWGSRTHRIKLYNAGKETLLYNNVVVTGTYDYTIPDNYLLDLDLSASNTWSQIEMQAKTSGSIWGVLEVRGFQTPYPNMAAIKKNDGSMMWPLQTIGYKDSEGVVHSVGRLL